MQDSEKSLREVPYRMLNLDITIFCILIYSLDWKNAQVGRTGPHANHSTRVPGEGGVLRRLSTVHLTVCLRLRVTLVAAPTLSPIHIGKIRYIWRSAVARDRYSGRACGAVWWKRAGCRPGRAINGMPLTAIIKMTYRGYVASVPRLIAKGEIDFYHVIIDRLEVFAPIQYLFDCRSRPRPKPHRNGKQKWECVFWTSQAAPTWERPTSSSWKVCPELEDTRIPSATNLKVSSEGTTQEMKRLLINIEVASSIAGKELDNGCTEVGDK